eukprot:12201413-Ditylum_brightwellii.AAC.1
MEEKKKPFLEEIKDKQNRLNVLKLEEQVAQTKMKETKDKIDAEVNTSQSNPSGSRSSQRKQSRINYAVMVNSHQRVGKDL